LDLAPALGCYLTRYLKTTENFQMDFYPALGWGDPIHLNWSYLFEITLLPPLGD